jgi:hypothetical protein
LFFRPGGHGALIENLDKLNSDLVYKKNIDNVIQDDQIIAIYKKALAGILIETQQQVFSHLQAIESGKLTEDIIESIIPFKRKKLCVVIDDEFSSWTLETKTPMLKAN